MRLRALLASLVLCVGACAAPKPKDGELPFPPQRLQQPGLSFLPPGEKDWWIAQKGADKLVIARLGAHDGDTHAIEASLIPWRVPGSSLERNRSIRAIREQAVPAPRFRIRSHDLSDQLVGATQCAISYLLAEDREPNTGTNTVGSVIVESMSLMCPHPANPAVGTMLTYTHRSYPEDQDFSFKARAGAVLNTFQFGDL
jgi:hypothetical protein